jgi:gluconokinase
MGVSGSGKTTVGHLLGEAMGVPFLDGDDLHSSGNKAKMRAGNSLDDAERLPWLQAIGRLITAESERGVPIVVACSALKRSYRDVLREFAPGLLFVHLDGDPSLIVGRIQQRRHEYMPSSLLLSQVEILEPLGTGESGIVVEIGLSPGEIVHDVLVFLASGRLADAGGIGEATP